jgi:putative hydrolase of the HAD superfamily
MPSPQPTSIRAITLDLDDTLWPVWPAIKQAEVVLHGWLAQHAPATAAAHDITALRTWRNRVANARPDLAHDLSALRRESLRLALHHAGDDPALADPAFEVFFAQRQRVTLYDDALPGLQALAARYPILALSNGNASVQVVGLGAFFRGAMSAQEFGIGKPDPRIFQAACARLGFAPHEVLHVGDDLALDVRGALGAGQPAVWINRDGKEHPDDLAHVPAAATLTELVNWLDSAAPT